MSTVILTALVGFNDELFSNILKIYVEPDSTIADVTYGNGVFWKKIPENTYKLHPSDISTGIDARHLPYADECLDCVVLDPPYIYSPKGTIKKSISSGYALNAEKGGELFKNQRQVLEFYRECIGEARRVLKPKGILIVKTKDTIESGKQVWMHVELMTNIGFICEDLFILVQTMNPAMDPKWNEQKHGRKNHSFFIILKKVD